LSQVPDHTLPREEALARINEAIPNSAKRKGVYRGRRRSLTSGRVEELKELVKAGAKKMALASEFGTSRETLYQSLHG